MAIQQGVRRGGDGRVFYKTQTAKGEVVDPAPANGGLPLPYWANFTVGQRGHVAEVRVGGSRRPVEVEEGMYGCEWSISFPKMQGTAAALAFYNLVVASGNPEELTWFTLGFGDGRESFTMMDCKMDVRNLSGTAGEEEWFTGDASGFGGLVKTHAAFVAQTYIDTPGFAMHEAVHSVWEMRGFTSSFTNGLRMYPVIAGPTFTRVSREWDYLVEGNETHTGEYRFLRRRTDLAQNADGDGGVNQPCMPSWSDVITFTNKCDPYDGLTLTWTGQKARDDNESYPGDDSEIEFTVPWVATNEVLAVV